MVDKVLHSQMPFTTGKQTINDRLTAAYHSLAGSQLGKTVCKATTEEEIGPKKKHLDYLLHCTNEPNVSIPQLANLLIERTTSTNWCTAFKGLITIHNLMCYGNERFSQFLASSNANFSLGNFLEKLSVTGLDMSHHVRRYAKYIQAKIYTYRMMAFDFCKVKRGREDGLMRTMPTDRLLKTLPLLQEQIDSLLEFQVTQSDLTNGVMNSCFILMFRDLIRLFACYNDGMINLLEKYFDMNKKQCREALDLYKGFLGRMDRVSEFLKVAESVGIDKSEIPDLAKAPSSLVEALEQHLFSLEGQKAPSGPGSRVTSPTSGPSIATQNAISKLSNTGGFASTFQEPTAMSLDEQTRRRILEEEERRLNMMKEQKLKEMNCGARQQAPNFQQQQQAKFNPFLQTPQPPVSNAQSSSIDDLLSLDFSSPAPAPSFTLHQQQQPSTNPFQQSSPFASQQQHAPAPFAPAAAYSNGHQRQDVAGFASDDAFARAFDAQPKQAQRVPAKPAGGVLKADLDSSLASLAENLNIGKQQQQDALKNKPVQWNQQRPVAPQQQPQMYGGYPANYGQQQPVYGAPMMGGAQQPMGYGGYGQMYPGQQPMQGVPQQMPMYGQQPQQRPAMDPFGSM